MSEDLDFEVQGNGSPIPAIGLWYYLIGVNLGFTTPSAPLAYQSTTLLHTGGQLMQPPINHES